MLALLAAFALAACGTVDRGNAGVPPAAAPAPASKAPAASEGLVAGRNERVLVYVPGDGETLAEIATRQLGSAERAWQIAEANGNLWQPVAGQPLIVPLVAPNPLGVTSAGAQTVPILCYHRLGPTAAKMNVTPSSFEAQMDWLAANHYQVLRLSELAQFLAGRRALPQRSVVLTFDDGYESVHRYAFGPLIKHGFPATLFVYTDFIGSRDALSWAQMDEMVRSGLVDIQAHSKTHRNLMERNAGESDAAYRARIDVEVRQPRQMIERVLGPAGVHINEFAYPFGDANDVVLDAMRREGYELGLTVNPGGNPFYASPLLLKRIMIFGDQDLEDFKARLQTRRGAPKP